jgi:hypothetical protein
MEANFPSASPVLYVHFPLFCGEHIYVVLCIA